MLSFHFKTLGFVSSVSPLTLRSKSFLHGPSCTEPNVETVQNPWKQAIHRPRCSLTPLPPISGEPFLILAGTTQDKLIGIGFLGLAAFFGWLLGQFGDNIGPTAPRKCLTCRGKGKVKCAVCKGKGCDACEQAGMVTCVECGGEVFQPEAEKVKAEATEVKAEAKER